MYRKAFIDVYLKHGFSFDEARSEIDFALDTLFNYGYKDFMLGKSLEQWQTAKLNKVIEERVLTHRPIQQIIGQAFFYGRKFFVDKYTLIPRPETEILVKEVLNISQNIFNPKILDIGTGSGCIPVTLLLENSNIIADAIDISTEAVETAKKNALFHNIQNNLNIYKSDLFENVTLKYNIIVSNPPYIPLKDKDTLQIEVRDFDPPNALYTKDENGIEYYEKIIKQSDKFLLPNGFLAFEIGQNQAEIVSILLKEYNFTIKNIVQDMNNIARVIIAQKR